MSDKPPPYPEQQPPPGAYPQPGFAPQQPGYPQPPGYPQQPGYPVQPAPYPAANQPGFVFLKHYHHNQSTTTSNTSSDDGFSRGSSGYDLPDTCSNGRRFPSGHVESAWTPRASIE